MFFNKASPSWIRLKSPIRRLTRHRMISSSRMRALCSYSLTRFQPDPRGEIFQRLRYAGRSRQCCSKARKSSQIKSPLSSKSCKPPWPQSAAWTTYRSTKCSDWCQRWFTLRSPLEAPVSTWVVTGRKTPRSQYWDSTPIDISKIRLTQVNSTRTPLSLKQPVTEKMARLFGR